MVKQIVGTVGRQPVDRALRKPPPPIEYDTSPVTLEDMERELNEQIVQRARMVRSAVNKKYADGAKKEARRQLIFSEILDLVKRHRKGATPNGET